MNCEERESSADRVRAAPTKATKTGRSEGCRATVRVLTEGVSPESHRNNHFKAECGTIGRPGDLDTGFWGARQLSIIATCCTQDTVQ